LADAHDREVVPRIDPSLDEPSMIKYLLRTYLFHLRRPAPRDVAAAERGAVATPLDPREVRRAAAEAASA
jgi:hypothetical protein